MNNDIAKEAMLERLFSSRASMLQYLSRIITLVKQDHIDAEDVKSIERVFEKALAILIETHTKAYKNASNALFKKWDLNA